MGWLEIAIGGAGLIGGVIGGMSQDAPDPAQVDDLDEYFSHPVAEAMAKEQLEVSKRLKAQLDDPRAKEILFSLIPEANMSPEDREVFAKEYSEIKMELGRTALEETNSMAGQTLQSLVERGVITQEQADKQKATNAAKINAIVKIHDKKLKASQISMTRDDWLRRMSNNSKSASVIANVNDTSARLMNQALTASQNYEIAKTGGISEIERALTRSNTQVGISADTNRFNLGVTGAANVVGAGADIYTKYKESRARDEFLKSNPELQKIFEASKAGIFN